MDDHTEKTTEQLEEELFEAVRLIQYLLVFSYDSRQRTRDMRRIAAEVDRLEEVGSPYFNEYGAIQARGIKAVGDIASSNLKEQLHRNMERMIDLGLLDEDGRPTELGRAEFGKVQQERKQE